MILSDRTILERGFELVEPFEPANVQPASIDLRSDEIYLVYPMTFMLASTYEVVHIPRDLAARVEGKSTFGRRGLGIHVTAGWVDSGFNGQLTLELFNFSEDLITIKKLQPICQLAFLLLDYPCIKPYHGKYQNQRGVTPAR